ncbi:metallophosphoesterase [Ammoniphilus resinae]|uniref:MPP superfamily phosphohydrolase n=1 Tax=Ammoniphilus resinae TaxID=861532 RepID=A0ABS4GRT0_9BACL|nr:metallophosphoesterase [Ammoniphilus resinae]MBP1932985.1 putative MPP superfamily phosphohydrolase [Ammoniphilus resinae]
MNPQSSITRRTFLKGALGLAALTALPLGYSYMGERFWYEVKEISLTFPHLPPAFSGLRLVQFSDVHLGHYFGQQELLEVVEKINNLNPDMICFTGDLVDQDGSELQAAIPILTELQAPLGKWAVLGNHDYYGEEVNQVIETLENAGFHVLNNTSNQITRNDQSIRVAGVDDSLKGNPDISKAIKGTTKEEFVLLLSHTPDYADQCKNYPVALQLSGHSHGGQIRVPFYGSLVTPPGAKKYIDGLIQIKDSNLLLYVNRGIGTTILPLRFSCRPEITLFTLHSI